MFCNTFLFYINYFNYIRENYSYHYFNNIELQNIKPYELP